MRIVGFMFFMFAILPLNSKGQSTKLNGQYIFERKGEMFSTYVFSSDSLFVSILSGDMGTFYGEGKFNIENDRLILQYDSTGIAKRVDKKFYITPTSNDTLRIVNINKHKIDIECDYSGQLETYKKSKR